MGKPDRIEIFAQWDCWALPFCIRISPKWKSAGVQFGPFWFVYNWQEPATQE